MVAGPAGGVLWEERGRDENTNTIEPWENWGKNGRKIGYWNRDAKGKKRQKNPRIRKGREANWMEHIS